MRTAAAALSLLLAALCPTVPTLNAQTPPQQREIAQYRGLLAAAAKGDLPAVKAEIKAGTDLNARDSKGRTALMLTGYREHHNVAEALIRAGADLNAVEHQAYDLLTISSVKNDLKMVNLAIAAGANTKQVTSPYEGTALIAAAH
ncbi:MAG: ankyrin repeat domain-containing protein, partial [Pseudomonadota bacterium]